MDNSWVLVGMMGAGKTSVGRLLATLSNREFLDTDQLIQRRLGRTIEKIFEFYGEAAFREHEKSIVSQLLPGLNVISTGGGAVVRDENWSQLKSLGTTIYLRCSAESLIERLTESKKKRPLLETDDWQERLRSILSSRESRYLESDLVFNLDGIALEEAPQILYNELKARGLA
jgi:shikimate kinase